MNVHDWLMNLPFSDPESSCRIVEVSFNQGSRKEFYRNASLQYFEKGELVTVEGVSGFDLGEVSLTGELVRMQLKKHRIPEDSNEIKRILRRSSPMDIEKWKETKIREKEILVQSRAIARNQGLQMKFAEVELQADGKKGTFYYTAEDRVDFRELIKIYSTEFKVKVEMRQIGSRQEAGKVGGIGSCGRELCCSTWLTDFKSVNTQAARYQNLSINQTKLSGQCGRLKCCLNYELDTYLDALQHFPTYADSLETSRGRAMLIKKDIFRNLMWYCLPDSTKQYPLTIERVIEIKEMNKQNLKPDELQAVEVVSSKAREVEPEYADVVGQISLKSLEKTSRRNRDKEHNKGRESQQRNRVNEPQGRGGGNPRQSNNPNAPQRGGNPNQAPKPNQPAPRPPKHNQAPAPGEPKPHKHQPHVGGQPKRPENRPVEGLGGKPPVDGRPPKSKHKPRPPRHQGGANDQKNHGKPKNED